MALCQRRMWVMVSLTATAGCGVCGVRNGEVTHSVMRVCDLVGENPSKDDLEWLLASAGVIESSAQKPKTV